ncbi:DUF397 domain-containing protein [Prauserella halophila]|nr:DUF397 domain-containing protein [Prauserella halophila]MCP2235726.1 protein of unknown function (DUF397) [Prauserella halophila]
MDADAKRRALDAIDVERVEWRRYGSGDGALDVAHVEHDGEPLTLMRSEQSSPPGVVLVFTAGEWDAFTAGARDGEFSETFDG